MINKELQKRILSSLVLIPIALFFIIKGTYFFNFFILICLFISIYEWHKMSKEINYTVLGIIFLMFSFYSVYYFRNEFYGDYLYLIIILSICVFTDIGGYIFGKLFKGPKLTKISPNKTLSGSLGSFILSISVSSLLLGYIFNTDLVDNILIGFFISLSVQIGDLFFSYLKRKASLKNTGDILPGHGGILDRIDGILLGIPVGLVYVLILVFTG